MVRIGSSIFGARNYPNSWTQKASYKSQGFQEH
jgi:hypothetical protein